MCQKIVLSLLGEDINVAAEREVLEETGVRCQFDSVLCVRHLHGYRYGCSDLLFVCFMKPLSTDIELDPVEIKECIWMDVSTHVITCSGVTLVVICCKRV